MEKKGKNVSRRDTSAHRGQGLSSEGKEKESGERGGKGLRKGGKCGVLRCSLERNARKTNLLEAESQN